MKQWNSETIRLKNKVTLAFLSILMLLSFPNPSNAQSTSLSLSPTLTELAIKPGKSATVKYKLTNNGDPSIIKILVEPFDNKEQSNISFELNNRDLVLGQTLFLNSSASRELNLTLLIPENIPEKDYYFNFIVESQPPPGLEGAANIRAKITLESPLLIVVTRDGRVEIKPKVSLFEVTPKNRINLLGFKLNIFNSYQSIPAVLVVDNKGKNLIKPAGKITVNGPLWQSITYNLTQENVLATSQQRIEINLPGRFLGNYTVSARISFGDNAPAIYSQSSFMVFPFKLGMSILAVFIFCLVVALIFRKKGINR